MHEQRSHAGGLTFYWLAAFTLTLNQTAGLDAVVTTALHKLISLYRLITNRFTSGDNALGFVSFG